MPATKASPSCMFVFVQEDWDSHNQTGMLKRIEKDIRVCIYVFRITAQIRLSLVSTITLLCLYFNVSFIFLHFEFLVHNGIGSTCE